MKIKGSVDVRGASRKAVFDVRKMVIEEVADAAKEIVSRTLSGRSITGHRFVKYTKGYRKFKIRMTGTGTPNLKLTGQMLDSIEHKVEVRSQTILWSIFFSNKWAEQKAEWNSIRRPFFGVSKLVVNRIRIRADGLLRYHKRREEEDG